MKKAKAYIKLVKPNILLLITLCLTFFYYIILVPTHRSKLFTALTPFTDFEFGLFVFSVLLLAAAGSIIYNYFNFESDREFNQDQPLAGGRISLDAAMYLHAAFAFLGIAIGFYLGYTLNNYKIGYLYIISALLLYLHSGYLRKIPLAGNLLVAGLMGFPLVLLMLFEVSFLKTISFEGASYVLDILLWQVRFYGGFVFLIALTLELIKDIINKQADAESNINTLAVQFGETASKVAACLVLFLLIAGLAFFMRGFIRANATKEFTYLAVAVVAPVIAIMLFIFFAHEKKQYLNISKLLQLVMLLGILSIPAFYFFNK